MSSTQSERPGQAWDAQLYDNRHAFVWRHGASLVELLDPKPGERTLDLGCGTGHLSARIAEAGAEVLGVDGSPEMVEAAARAYPAMRFEVADARTLKYEGQFDAVFSNAVLHWVKEAEAVARGVARALRPGGRFVAEFGGKGNVQKIMSALQSARTAVGIEPAELPWYYPSLAEYASLLERVGLEVTFATLFDRPTPLEGGETGLRSWVTMFGGQILAAIPGDRREEFFRRVEDESRGELFRDGVWTADYRRLRIVAVRPREAE